jgi:hypothetical protein
MQPKSPVLTQEFVDMEVVYAKNQPQYNPLPALRNKDGVVLSRWTLSESERTAIAKGADIFLSVHTFNQPLQPLQIEVGECDRDLMAIATATGLVKD